MNDLAAVLEAAEERASHPLFTERRPGQCAWPMWGDATPIEEKRCCGGPVSPDARIPYCREHIAANRGNGTPSERHAPRKLLTLTNTGA